MKKILMVCQHYYPENFQVTDICEELAKKGYSVTALVGLPNYPVGYVSKKYKFGKNRQEVINGVNVLRCFEIGRRKNVLFLALNYISFWFSSLIYVKKLKDDYDIVLGYETSPITMISAASKYAKKYNKPFYLFCVDIWPECLKVYIKSENNFIFKIFKKISKKLYSSATKILCTSKSFISYLVNIHNIDKKRIMYLPQFGDDSLLNRKLNLDNNGIINLVFMGNVGKEQNLGKVIESLSKIKDQPYIFHIVGDGSDLKNAKKITNILNMNNKVVFYGRRPKSEMINFYELADACILPLRCNNEIGKTLPNKLQNYLAAGKPILGMISGSAKEIIEQSKCGLCVDGNDVDGFSNIVKYFIENINNEDTFSKNAKMFYENNFKKELIINRLIEIIEKNYE